MIKSARIAFGLMVALGLATNVGAEEKSGVEAKAAFARLKTLAGDWKVAEGRSATARSTTAKSCTRSRPPGPP